jgi:hypothetical protein
MIVTALANGLKQGDIIHRHNGELHWILKIHETRSPHVKLTILSTRAPYIRDFDVFSWNVFYVVDV